ncbi:MAG: calcium-transporting P-type ATPase, PMR1-type [Candidatus Bathyarchaeia archaeon]
MNIKKPWHTMEPNEVVKELKSSIQEGLSDEEALTRLKQFGPNELEKEKKVSPIKVFIRQFKEILIIILLIAILISIILGETLDAIAILAIVMACAFLGFFQEYRAEKALEALKKMAAPKAVVIRNGKEKEILAKDIVPGDIILLNVGQKIPADARIIEGLNLKIDESMLTGESAPVEKAIDPIPLDTPISEMNNMVFASTIVVHGKGKAIVTSTGMNTEFGRIAKLIQTLKVVKTPLEIKMQQIGKWLGITAICVVAIISALGLLRGYGVIEMLIWGVSLAVAAVPEALPAVVTGALAIGTRKMAKRKAIVRKLPAVETLGCTTVICADKTGTLTKAEMTARKIFFNNEMIHVTGIGYEPKGNFLKNNKPMEIDIDKDECLSLILKAALLCNDASLEKDEKGWHIVGDPTEGALVVLAMKAGLSQENIRKDYPRINEIPFTSERKMMTTIHSTLKGDKIAFSKGAVEVLLKKCTKMLINGEIVSLNENEKENILKVNEQMAKDALRVLGIAYKCLPKELNEFNEEEVEKGLIFLGLVGMIDPPREEAIQAILLCKKAGIKVKMITGDHKLTAMAIAKELGLLKENELVITGAELDKLSDEDFEKIVENIAIYARVLPEHKLRIVKALKKKGHVVAMTGDGINDAPALKNSDIGIAMGITGTDVTKEASDMILADDNFATIVAAIEEGRAIYDNIKKYLMFLLSCNIGEILIMAIATLLGLPLPLLAIHILWVNLVTDGLPAIALGVDPADIDIMERMPRSPKESIFHGIKGIIIAIAILLALVTLPIYFSFLSKESLIKARTMVFAIIVMFELFISFGCRSEKHPLIKIGPFKNRFLVISVIISALMILFVIYVPIIGTLFKTTQLTLNDWAIVFLASSSGLIAIEAWKAFNYLRLKPIKKL